VTRGRTPPVRLRTADGTIRRRLPAPKVGRVADPEARPRPAVVLRKVLRQRWKTFRKRLRKGLPYRPQRIDEAVHDLRTASRRLLSVLAVVERICARKAARRLARRVDDILGRLGALSDLTVQRELSSRLEIPAGKRALVRYGRTLERDLRRSVRKARRQILPQEASALRRDARRIRRRLRKRSEGNGDTGGSRQVLNAARSSFSELRTRRRAVDPTRLDTLHRMRLSLKRFRYLMETLEPLVPGVSKDALEALHALQTNMGDLHDLEVLSSSLAAFAKDEPAQAADLASVLAELEARHSGMVQSFLKSADAILQHWQRTIAAA
jgi:CHAD domain-containing protein